MNPLPMHPHDSSALDAGTTPTPRRRRCIAVLLVVIPLGLVWRLAPLHLPPFAFKYGGSMLWAAAVYWALGAAVPRWKPVPLALLAATVATCVELLKLVFWPPLDSFRETLAGKLLLGRYFSFGALAAYGIAIVVTCILDHSLASPRRRPLRSATPSRPKPQTSST